MIVKSRVIWCVSVTQSCLTLCDLMDYSPPGSSVHGILQARILEYVFISFSRGSSPPRIEPRSARRQTFYCLRHEGNPKVTLQAFISR